MTSRRSSPAWPERHGDDPSRSTWDGARGGSPSRIQPWRGAGSGQRRSRPPRPDWTTYQNDGRVRQPPPGGNDGLTALPPEQRRPQARQPLLSPRMHAVRRARTSAVDRDRLAVLAAWVRPRVRRWRVSVSSRWTIGWSPLRCCCGWRAVGPWSTSRGYQPGGLQATSVPAASTSDPRSNLQWGLSAIGWYESVIRSAPEVTVGVLDSGVDTSHPDLQAASIDYHHEHVGATDLLGHITSAESWRQLRTTPWASPGIACCRLKVWKGLPGRAWRGWPLLHRRDGVLRCVGGSGYLGGEDPQPERGRPKEVTDGGRAVPRAFAQLESS